MFLDEESPTFEMKKNGFKPSMPITKDIFENQYPNSTFVAGQAALYFPKLWEILKIWQIGFHNMPVSGNLYVTHWLNDTPSIYVHYFFCVCVYVILLVLVSFCVQR